MGLLAKLMGTEPPKHKLYVDSAFSLIRSLAKKLPLPEWHDVIAGYTEEEQEAISSRFSIFQSIANSAAQADGAEKMLFHPDLAEPIQRMLTEVALKGLADSGWKYREGRAFQFAMDSALDQRPSLPAEWQKKISTYLKAYLCNMNPFVFLDIADLLIRAGNQQYATQAVTVALEFPLWAGSRKPGQFEAIAAQSTCNLFEDEEYAKVYRDPLGFYSDESIARLRERARILGAEAWKIKERTLGGR